MCPCHQTRNSKLEYVWLDGYLPEPNLRSKTKIVDKDLSPLPTSIYGASMEVRTQQAEGKSSDCVLKPVALYPDSTRKNGYLVMCEVLFAEPPKPHPSNFRATVEESEDLWIGLEQEYFFYENGRPLLPAEGYPAPQGPYYTGIGYKNVGDVARQIVEEHIRHHLGCWNQPRRYQRRSGEGSMGISDFRQGIKEDGDDMWMARYLMIRLCEKYGIDVEFHCKDQG